MGEFTAALAAVGQLDVILAVLTGVSVGVVFGLLPGLSGLTALAVLIPFVYGMEPMEGLAFLLAAHATIYTGGAVTAVLLGIPGSPPNAATILDGVPLRNKGLGGVAVGAALTASAVGGVFGAAILLLLLPVLEPLVLSFGSPETLLLAVIGLAFIAALAGRQALLGLFAGVLGIALSFVGDEPVSGVLRYWMGSDYLIDGFNLVPIALGLFAVPEIVSLMAGGGGRRQLEGAPPLRQMLQGARAVFVRPWLTLSSSGVGTVVGIVPGVGGETAPFVAYALGRQTSRVGDEFGTGVVDGVIAPEASNNAKEGGALVPTLALGIPGSSGMALLLGAFIVLGLQPGPRFLESHSDIAYGLVIVLVVSNVLASSVLLLATPLLSRIVTLSPALLAPVLAAFVVLGGYAVGTNITDIWVTFAFGALGILFVRLGFNRAAFLLGFVLGPEVERYLAISLNLYGWEFLLRPGCIVLVAVLVLALSAPLLRTVVRRRSAH